MQIDLCPRRYSRSSILATQTRLNWSWSGLGRWLGTVLLSSLLANPVLAAINAGSISVSSYASPVINGVASVDIYGGFADTGSACNSAGTPNGDGTNPCDSCAGLLVDVCTFPSGGIACNTKNVYGALPLIITFSVGDATKITKGTSTIKAMTSSSSEITLESSGTTAASAIDINTTLTAKILWSQIFSKLEGSTTNGTTSFKSSFKVGVAKDGSALTSSDDQFTVNVYYRAINTTETTYDPTTVHTDCPTTSAVSGEGVCGFSVKAGDKKVYIKDVYIPTATWPNQSDSAGSGVLYSGMRVYYAPDTDFCNIKISTAGYADLPIDSSGNLPTSKIFNLTNDQNYVFLAATIDQSGNITRFSSQAYLTAETTYKHHAMPGEVVGLLNGKKCFIATAAFGSEMEPQVDIIRQFRNRYLLPHGWGRSFVRWYYKTSPPFADYIAKNELLRAGTRAILWPVVLLSSLAVEYGLIVTSLVVLVALLLMKLGLARVRQLSRRLPMPTVKS